MVLEGLDGSGTTTQLRLADRRFRDLGIPHWCTSEPTDGPVGRLVRDVLQHRVSVDPCTLAYLFAADRHDHLWSPAGGIVQRIRSGQVVVCDRYLFSSLAYQSLECGYELVLSLNRTFPLPAHLVFLDTPVEVSQRRLVSRPASPDLFEAEQLQQPILSGYARALAEHQASGMKVYHLDGTENEEQVFEKFWTVLSSLPMIGA